MNSLRDVYKKPYSRAGPWLIGILLGVDVVNNRTRKLGKVYFYIMILYNRYYI